jgi:hypothetical protein
VKRRLQIPDEHFRLAWGIEPLIAIAESRKEQSMRTAVAVSTALLLAGTAYVLPAHAQMTPQAQGATPQVQSQPSTAGQSQTQPSYPSAQSQGGARLQTQATPQPTAPKMTGAQSGTQGQPPQGSFRSSCNDVRMQGDTLIAFCRRPDGTWQTSAIGPVNQCKGDIQDVNGQLTCRNEVGVGSSTPPARPQSPPTQPKY